MFVLPEAEHVLHVVETGRLILEPKGGADGPAGEGETRGCLVGEFDAFAVGGEDHGMIAHDIAAAQRVHADFTGFARAYVAAAAVDDVGIEGGVGFRGEDL